MSPRCESSGCIEVEQYGDYIRIRSTITGTVTQCTPEEWHSFLADLGDGRWAHIGADAEVSA